ncbi:MAG: helix-turn-helix domain-containing protein [Oscillospiraceae bacterium]|nr:helix-turn-helix domain-containing protein [Oscillospiraceae bacterium]
MDKTTVGRIISEQRKKCGLSLSDLCNGICNKSTFMRIESGELNVNTDILSRLLERLGIHLDFDEASNFDDILVRQIIRNANQADVTGDRQEALRLLNTIGADYDSFSLQNKQRYDVINTMLLFKDGVTSAEARLCNLEKSMRLTQPNYSFENLPLIMTDMEEQILRYIANTYTMIEDYNSAIAIYYHLKFYIENDTDKVTSARKLVNICYNLSKCLGLTERYTESIDVAKESIDFCRFTNNVCMLPMCMYNYAWSLTYRNKSDDRDRAREIILEIPAYCTPMTSDIDELKKNINNLCEILGVSNHLPNRL